jgi:hypothetical protein
MGNTNNCVLEENRGTDIQKCYVKCIGYIMSNGRIVNHECRGIWKQLWVILRYKVLFQYFPGLRNVSG